MKKQLFARESEIRSPNRLLFCFSGVLLFGAICGVITAYCLNLSTQQALFSDVTGFLYADRSKLLTFWQALWNIGRVPILVFLLAFTCFGFVGIPFAVGLQGYLISFSEAVMVRLLGWKGFLLGIASFGVQAVFLLPCLLVLSSQAFSLSKQFLFAIIPRKRDTMQGLILFPRGFWFALILSCIVLCLGAAADYFFTGHLVSFVSNTLIFH